MDAYLNLNTSSCLVSTCFSLFSLTEHYWISRNQSSTSPLLNQPNTPYCLFAEKVRIINQANRAQLTDDWSRVIGEEQQGPLLEICVAAVCQSIVSWLVITESGWSRACIAPQYSLQQTRALPSVIALGKKGFALGKAFVECCTRQRAVGISLHDKGFFAERRISGTRQSLCRVPEKHSAKIYTRQNENAKKPKNNSKIFQK